MACGQAELESGLADGLAALRLDQAVDGVVGVVADRVHLLIREEHVGSASSAMRVMLPAGS